MSVSDPTRWGNAPRLTKALREGMPGVPAIPLARPFAGWVARGWRRHKYLNMGQAASRPEVYYLYSTASTAQTGWFDDDFNDLLVEFEGDGERVGRALYRRWKAEDSLVGKAIVGVARLLDVENGVWRFSGGALLADPIPLSLLAFPPYGGSVFYPFGREA